MGRDEGGFDLYLVFPVENFVKKKIMVLWGLRCDIGIDLQVEVVYFSYNAKLFNDVYVWLWG